MTDFQEEAASDGVRTLRDGAAALLEIDRPEVRNALDMATGARLRDEVVRLGEDPGVRALMLTGAGGSFSSGADLGGLGAGLPLLPGGRPDLGHVLETTYNPLITALRTMQKPVVAAVPGPAVGVGCSIALAADLVLAAEEAYFLMAFVNIGLALDGGASLLLTQRVGTARAAEIALLGERLPADRAREWGLVNRVVGADDLRGAAEELTVRLSEGPTRALAAIKGRLASAADGLLAAQLAGEAADQRAMAQTDDFLEGAGAFLQKRPASFKGT